MPPPTPLKNQELAMNAKLITEYLWKYFFPLEIPENIKSVRFLELLTLWITFMEKMNVAEHISRIRFDLSSYLHDQ